MTKTSITLGYLAQVACTWEALARKAGNVCPGREYPDLTVNDFLVSAAAIAPIMTRAAGQPVGVTILQSIEATRRVVTTNTNLGMVLLIAPLATVPRGESIVAGVNRVLDSTTVDDARAVYEAIRLANPSGLGKAREQDVNGEPTLPLRAVMALAKERDLIAAQYDDGFQFVLNHVVPHLVRFVHLRGVVERAIVETQLNLLATARDSHILRKLGSESANEVKRWAINLLEYAGDLDTSVGRAGFLEVDARLRDENHARNPGTTADLIAAGLFVALREGLTSLETPFVWESHPFAVGSSGAEQGTSHTLNPS